MAAANGSSRRRVCVMEASGRVGSALVQLLVQRGYSVHAALQTPPPLAELRSFEGLSDSENKRLKVFNFDPLDYHSVVDASKGCCGLFYSFEPPSDHPTYDLWQGLSKTLAEKTAWALAMDRGVNMVSINGGLITSPDLTISHPYLKGAAEMYQDGVFVTVDISFLVDSHICVFEDFSSYGRYLCFDHVINCNKDAAKLAHTLLPSDASSPALGLDDSRVYQQRISNKKLSKMMADFDAGAQVE